jgi:hypothetical protein
MSPIREWPPPPRGDSARGARTRCPGAFAALLVPDTPGWLGQPQERMNTNARGAGHITEIEDFRYALTRRCLPSLSGP